jgi:hypothetical protein
MGAAMVVAPQPFARAFAGRDGRRAGPQLLARAAGGRDAALGTAAVIALARGREVRLWTATQLGADLTDLVATAAMGNDLPRTPRRIGLGLAASATAVLAGALVALREGKPGSDELAGQPEQTMAAGNTADGLGSVVIGGDGQDDPGAGGTQAA